MTRIHISPPPNLLKDFQISAEISGVPLARQILWYAQKGKEVEEDLLLSQFAEERKASTKNWFNAEEIWE